MYRKLITTLLSAILFTGCSDPECAEGERQIGSTCQVVPGRVEQEDVIVDAGSPAEAERSDRGTSTVPSSPDAGHEPSREIAAGMAAWAGVTCAWHSSGATSCWGQDVADASIVRTKPEIIAALSGVNRIWIRGGHACAQFPGKQLRCWGSNSAGELGVGDSVKRAEPAPVLGLGPIREAALGDTYSCALEEGSGVKCWGSDSSLVSLGRLGGDVRPVGKEEELVTPRKVPDVLSAAELKIGLNHACVRTLEGAVKCWGNNVYGALGDGTRITRGRPETVRGITNPTALALGVDRTCVLLQSSQVMCWNHPESSDRNLLNTPGPTPAMVENLTDVTAISAASGHVCALHQSGVVSCWGSNSSGQLGDGTTEARATPVQVVGLTGVVEVVASSGHTCARLTSGGIRCWGDNQYGQLGDGTTLTRITPVPVLGFE